MGIHLESVCVVCVDTIRSLQTAYSALGLVAKGIAQDKDSWELGKNDKENEKG